MFVQFLLLGPKHRGARTLLELLRLLLLFSNINDIFEGLYKLKTLWKFAHMPEVVKNVYGIWYGLQNEVGQNYSIAPPIHFQHGAPRATFHTCMKFGRHM